MNRTEKEQVVERLARTFQDSQSVILLNFKGISVPDITELRDRVRESGGQYQVIKNRLAIRAAEDTPLAGFTELFAGPTAIAYTESDSVALAKTLRDFLVDREGMEFKAGVLDGQPLSVDQVEQLATMPSRDELLSKLMFLLQAPLTQLASALQSPLRNLAYLLSQLAEHEARPGSAAAAGEKAEAETGEAADATPAEEAPPEEVEAEAAAEADAEPAPDAEASDAEDAKEEASAEAAAEEPAAEEPAAEEPAAEEEESKEE